VDEPLGGAHRNGTKVLEDVGNEIAGALKIFEDMGDDEVRRQRREKYLKMGVDF